MNHETIFLRNNYLSYQGFFENKVESKRYLIQID